MISNDVKLSKAFKAHTTKAIFAIIFFIITYIIIFALAVTLTALCVYGGIQLIIAKPMIATIGLGGGLAGLGILILIFLLKFIFKSHKVDRSHLIQVKKENEPRLFSMIDEIVKEVGTSFPKRVYLSHDVNAAVFYNSNFWSMFIPTRKNLQIGIGLANSVSEEELKAILAHEFGHFSQRTMKVGSYVYNVNQVIFNMLNDNESYENMVQSWANASGYFSIFAILAIRIVEGIQWILRKLYLVVNKSYMGLSREMEFHADEIAANVTGYMPLKTSLLRMNLADFAFNQTLNFYGEKVAENISTKNCYDAQFYLMQFYANESEIPILNEIPDVSIEDLNKFNKSKLVIKDQWASHPSTEERIARLEATKLSKDGGNQQLSIKLFSDPQKIKELLTQRLFSNVTYTDTVAYLSLEDFKAIFVENYKKNTFSKRFNGYYDDKNPMPFVIEDLHKQDISTSIEELYSDKKVQDIYELKALEADIETITQISNKEIPVKTFDYDGRKYRRKDTKKLLVALKKKKAIEAKKIQKNDIQIFQYFEYVAEAKGQASHFRNLYRDFFAYDSIFDEKQAIYTTLTNKLQFISQSLPVEQIRTNFYEVQRTEKILKNEIRELLADASIKDELTKEMNDNFEHYLSKDWDYFGQQQYYDNSLQVLFTAMNHYVHLLSRKYFLQKKKVIGFQEEKLTTASTDAILQNKKAAL